MEGNVENSERSHDLVATWMMPCSSPAVVGRYVRIGRMASFLFLLVVMSTVFAMIKQRMALYTNNCGDSATGRPHSTAGAGAENGPSPARSYPDTRIDGYAGSRRGMNLEIHERDLHANPKQLKRRQRNRSQSAAPMIIRFSIGLMLGLIENKRRRVERWRGARP